MVQHLKNGEDIDAGKKKIKARNTISETYLALRDHLSDSLGTKVQLSCTGKGKGKICIPFENEEQLEHIMSIFDGLKQGNTQQGE